MAAAHAHVRMRVSVCVPRRGVCCGRLKNEKRAYVYTLGEGGSARGHDKVPCSPEELRPERLQIYEHETAGNPCHRWPPLPEYYIEYRAPRDDCL